MRKERTSARATAEFRKLAASWAERTAVDQGLPPRVADVEVLRKVAQLLELDPKRIK
jgi:hypothetical protein